MKRNLSFAAAAVLLLSAAFFAARLRGSVKIRPGSESAVQEKEAVCLYQRDEQWERDRLGDSQYTMGSSGCLTVCLSAVLQMQDMQVEGCDSLAPGAVNRWLSERKVYDSQGNIQWQPLEQTIGAKVVRKTAAELEEGELEALLEAGIYPIVRVRVKGVGSFHYVVLTGQGEDGCFRCMDPLNEARREVSLSLFGSRIYAIRYLKIE